MSLYFSMHLFWDRSGPCKIYLLSYQRTANSSRGIT